MIQLTKNSTDVALISLNDVSECTLEHCVDVLFTQAIAGQSLRSKRVLLKPNLISKTNCALSCTEAEVIIASACWFLDRGAKVSIGDSPAFGSARAILRTLGLEDKLEHLGVSIAEFNRIENVLLPEGHKIGLAVAPRECDLLVNLARVKAHAQARVTLSLKNFYGCVGGLRKGLYHMLHGGEAGCFADILVQLPGLMPPSVSLLGGRTAMHEDGPIGGKPYALNLLGCSTNPIALDTAYLHILGINPERCPLWIASEKKSLSGVQFDELNWLQEDGVDIYREGFVVPEKLMPIRFDPFRFVKSTCRRILAQ